MNPWRSLVWRSLLSPTLTQIFVATCLVCLGNLSALAQIHYGGSPMSLGSHFKSQLIESARLPSYQVPTEDFDQLKIESPENMFAKAVSVKLNPEIAGVWETLSNGDRLWRLKIEAPGASSLRAIFDDFYIPKGAKLYLFTEGGESILGAFTYQNNKTSARFGTDILPGDIMYLEYYSPKKVKEEPHLNLWRVDYGFRPIGGAQTKEGNSLKDFGESNSCNINVACPEGDEWQEQRRGIVNIVLTQANGSAVCTGSLLNNTAWDKKPYLLTGLHCERDLGQSYIDTWVFVFNYESQTCNNPVGEPARDQSISGAQIIAKNLNSDLLLLELSESIPDAYQAYYNAWDNRGNVPAQTVCIHHPSGDIKKIAIDQDSTEITSVSIQGRTLPADHAWEVVWEQGTTERGSSGAPLFNRENKAVIGQLFGGGASCNNPGGSDYYGRFSKSWSSGSNPEARLSDWLDPINAGANFLNGWNGIRPENEVILYSIEPQTCLYINETPTAFTVYNAGTNTIQEFSLSYELVLDSVVLDSGRITVNNVAPDSLYRAIVLLDYSLTDTTYEVRAEVSITGTSDGLSTNNQSNLLIQTGFQPFVDSFPYADNFDVDSGNWLSGGTSSSWERSTLQGDMLNDDLSQSIQWVTNADGEYANNENSFLLSPIFDLSQLSEARLEATLIRDIEKDFDGLQVQVSTNCGQNWLTLGDQTTGQNWYNSDTTLLPFEDFVNVAWSGPLAEESPQIVISHPLDAWLGEPNVQFRFLFRSDNSITREGVAIDNFRIEGDQIEPGDTLRPSIFLYPNPIGEDGKLRARLSGGLLAEDISEVLIFDAQGNRLRDSIRVQRISQDQANFSPSNVNLLQDQGLSGTTFLELYTEIFNPGFYLIKINTRKGGFLFKIIRQ